VQTEKLTLYKHYKSTNPDHISYAKCNVKKSKIMFDSFSDRLKLKLF